MIKLPKRFVFKNSEGWSGTADLTIDMEAKEIKCLVMWIKDDGYPVGVIYNPETVAGFINDSSWVVTKKLGEDVTI